MEMIKDLPVILFESKKQWRTWLKDNFDQSRGVWLKHAKKASGKESVSYQEALEESLCYGWIDSQKQKYDNDYFMQKYTPRGPKSIWSKINVAKVETLIKSGSIKPPGLAAIEAAKLDGRWDAAYDSPSTTTVPKDFQEALESNLKAKQFFETLNKTNVYGICWRIQTAKKPETRAARIQKLVQMLEQGEKLH